MKKRILSILLAAVLLVCLLPMTALADTEVEAFNLVLMPPETGYYPSEARAAEDDIEGVLHPRRPEAAELAHGVRVVVILVHVPERRVVAARRVRDGETEAELKKLVERSWKKP